MPLTDHPIPENPDYAVIQRAIVTLLESARSAAARSVNALMTATYWAIGRRIVEFEQAGQGRAGYGDVLIERLSSDLSSRFGRGFSRQNLQQMRLFSQGWQNGFNGFAEQPRPAKFARHCLANLLPETSLSIAELAQAFNLPFTRAGRRFYARTTKYGKLYPLRV